MRLHGQWLIEDDLNKRSAKHTNKSTLVARDANMQLGSSCVLAPVATNVDFWIPISAYLVSKYNVIYEKILIYLCRTLEMSVV